MPKRLKKHAQKPKSKRPASDPNLRVHQAMAEMEAKQAQGPPVEPGSPQPTPEQISAYMAKLGAKGGKASGARRMENLTAKRRKEIAKRAAAARWKNRPERS